MASLSKSVSVVLLSGGTGRTAQYVLDSALAQFPDSEARVSHRVKVRSARAAIAEVREAAESGAIVLHTFVDPKLREAVSREAQRLGVPLVDLLGPTLAALDDVLGPPRNKPGLSYELHRERFDRIDAVDFTLSHDDGHRLRDLKRADIVLVGVSRVSKSVTCFYLACRGVFAANVPLVPGVDLPREVLRLPRSKVLGLTMHPARLRSLRAARQGVLGDVAHDYSDDQCIAQELRRAQTLFAERKWRTIDVSYKSIEEVAHEILSLLGR